MRRAKHGGEVENNLRRGLLEYRPQIRYGAGVRVGFDSPKAFQPFGSALGADDRMHLIVLRRETASQRASDIAGRPCDERGYAHRSMTQLEWRFA